MHIPRSGRGTEGWAEFGRVRWERICGPPAPWSAVPHSLPSIPESSVSLGGCRRNGSCFGFETPSGRSIPFCASPGKTSSALSPSPITGLGEALVLWLGSAWWQPEANLPQWLDYIRVCRPGCGLLPGPEGLTRVWSPACAVQGGRDGENLGTFSTHPKLGSFPVLGWWALGQLLVISANEKLVAGKQVGLGG